MSETIIETRRLRFRPWVDADANVLFKYASDPDVGPRAGWPPHQKTMRNWAIGLHGLYGTKDCARRPCRP